MTGDNFYSLQDDWKVEIDEMLSVIRFKEQVRLFFYPPLHYLQILRLFSDFQSCSDNFQLMCIVHASCNISTSQ
jgi:hypothetical protein